MPSAQASTQPKIAASEKPGAPVRAERPIRVMLQQIALPKYRVPVFQALSRRPGVDFTLVYSEMPSLPNVEPQGFKAVLVPLPMRKILGQALVWHPGQFGKITRRDADVVILSWSMRYLSLIPGLLRARLLGIPVVVWGHGVSKRESGLRMWLRTRVARLADAVVFYNHTIANQFVERGFPKERVFVAINSLDQTPIQAARQSRLDRPGELHAFQVEKSLAGRKIVFFVSRLEQANRLDLLISAADTLRKQFPDLLVLIVGSGQERENLEKLVQSHALNDHVRFLGAIYNEADLAPYFLSSQVFCYPSNMGLSLLHAFGYGLPVVTGNDPTLHGPEIEALRDGENGLLFQHGDAVALAAALERVLSDDALRARLATDAHRTVMERFSVEQMVDGLEASIRYAMRK